MTRPASRPATRPPSVVLPLALLLALGACAGGEGRRVARPAAGPAPGPTAGLPPPVPLVLTDEGLLDRLPAAIAAFDRRPEGVPWAGPDPGGVLPAHRLYAAPRLAASALVAVLRPDPGRAEPAEAEAEAVLARELEMATGLWMARSAGRDLRLLARGPNFTAQSPGGPLMRCGTVNKVLADGGAATDVLCLGRVEARLLVVQTGLPAAGPGGVNEAMRLGGGFAALAAAAAARGTGEGAGAPAPRGVGPALRT